MVGLALSAQWVPQATKSSLLRDWFPCAGAVLSLAQTHRGRPLASLCWEHESLLSSSLPGSLNRLGVLGGTLAHVTLLPGIRICNQNMEEEFLDPYPRLSS